MYTGVTLSPTIAKLFEYIFMKIYGDHLSSDVRQFGFKKHFRCRHALFIIIITIMIIMSFVVPRLQ